MTAAADWIGISVSVLFYVGCADNRAQPMGHVWPSAMADFTKWSDLDGCTDAPVPMPMHPLCQIRSKCTGGAEVVLCSPNAGHVLYAEAAREMVAVPDVAWEVLQRHALP
jgi:poly(3-hydroxybutyrate) depolymerase